MLSECEDVLAECRGKKIKGMTLDDNEFFVLFADNSTLRIFDFGQDCCEERFMSTDDDMLEYFTGATFLGVQEKSSDFCAEDTPGGDVHEYMFVEVRTDRGCVTLVNHNKHNGYYGGFSIRATLRRGPQKKSLAAEIEAILQTRAASQAQPVIAAMAADVAKALLDGRIKMKQ